VEAGLQARHGGAGAARVVGFLLGMAAWWQSADPVWIVGALLMILDWPVTYFAILPTNEKLMATDPGRAGPESRALIRRWGGSTRSARRSAPPPRWPASRRASGAERGLEPKCGRA
jgi:hypothetical protein